MSKLAYSPDLVICISVYKTDLIFSSILNPNTHTFSISQWNSPTSCLSTCEPCAARYALNFTPQIQNSVGETLKSSLSTLFLFYSTISSTLNPLFNSSSSGKGAKQQRAVGDRGFSQSYFSN